MIDYFLGQAPQTAVTLTVLDSTGNVLRTFSSERATADTSAVAARPSEDEDAPRRARPAPRLTTDVGLNRFIWDLTLPGPRDGRTGQRGENGPTIVPGRYQVRFTAGGQTLTQPLVVRPDPRVTRDGVTLADMRGQLEHNIRVRELVSDANRAVVRLREARTRLNDASASSDTARRVRALEDKLLTPPVRYSTPGLQSHITYLYGMTNQADERVGRDAKERYQVLRRELDGVIAEINALLGPDKERTQVTNDATDKRRK
jgi:hypothetical protein